MATAQTATGPHSRRYPTAATAPPPPHPSHPTHPRQLPAMASHVAPREPSHTRVASNHAAADDFRGVKRRAELQDEFRAREEHPAAHPDYTHHAPYRGPDKQPLGPASRLAPGGGGPSYPPRNTSSPAYGSPRTHLPSIHSLSSSGAASDDAAAASMAKKRRPAQQHPQDAYQQDRSQSFVSYPDEDRYRGHPPPPPHAQQQQGRDGLGPHMPPNHGERRTPPYPDERGPPPAGYGPPPHSARLPPGHHSPPPGPHHLPAAHPAEDFFRPPHHGPDDHYDQGTLLARRRGDVAQAKASKLHIDVGSAASDRSLETSAPPPHAAAAFHLHPRAGTDPNLIARSAPPTKVSFSDRDGQAPPSFDPRAGPHHRPDNNYSLHHHYSGGGHHGGGLPPRGYPDGVHANGPVTRSPPSGGRNRTPGSGGEPPNNYTSSRMGPGPGAGPPPAGYPTSSTPLTSRFVPQTATLPSPAYHTTRMMQAPPPHTSSAPAATTANASGVQGPSRGAAGLISGPPTARLPDHLRSPPSSKTQFLSLFANFYDSLSDSRTLKATLEDQVRRSNALLQTLQKSSKVLEATVDRKIREERSAWESRVRELEARVRHLEGGEPIAPPARSSSNSPSRRQGDDDDEDGDEAIKMEESYNNGQSSRRPSDHTNGSDDSDHNTSKQNGPNGAEATEGDDGADGRQEDK
ncbi:unnamed protein product [Sympodiomycopsis kandeliae]